jgi:hypothetical protein
MAPGEPDRCYFLCFDLLIPSGRDYFDSTPYFDPDFGIGNRLSWWSYFAIAMGILAYALSIRRAQNGIVRAVIAGSLLVSGLVGILTFAVLLFTVEDLLFSTLVLAGGLLGGWVILLLRKHYRRDVLFAGIAIGGLALLIQVLNLSAQQYYPLDGTLNSVLIRFTVFYFLFLRITFAAVILSSPYLVLARCRQLYKMEAALSFNLRTVFILAASVSSLVLGLIILGDWTWFKHRQAGFQANRAAFEHQFANIGSADPAVAVEALQAIKWHPMCRKDCRRRVCSLIVIHRIERPIVDAVRAFFGRDPEQACKDSDR